MQAVPGSLRPKSFCLLSLHASKRQKLIGIRQWRRGGGGGRSCGSSASRYSLGLNCHPASHSCTYSPYTGDICSTHTDFCGGPVLLQVRVAVEMEKSMRRKCRGGPDSARVRHSSDLREVVAQVCSTARAKLSMLDTESPSKRFLIRRSIKLQSLDASCREVDGFPREPAR